MALKPLKPRERKMMEKEIQKIEEQNFQNEKVSKITEDMAENVTNNQDTFFNTQNVVGSNTPIQGFEIELEEIKVIPQGKYKFIIENLSMENQVPTQYGIKNRISIQYRLSTILNGENSTFDLSQKYNLSSNINSNFYKMYKQLTFKAPVGKINLRNLLGMKGVCEIKHIIMDDKNIFPKIVNLKPDIEENETFETAQN